MLRTMAAWAAVTVATALFTAYVAITFLYLSPPNPLTLQLWPVILRTEHPFFAQNWHLFAPSPIRTNLVLTVRCRVGDRVGPWRDPFAPLLARHHANRITAMGKVIRIPGNTMHLVLGWSADEWRPLLCRRDRGHPVCRGEDPRAIRQRELGQFLVQRIASMACDDAVGPDQASHVQARILIHEPPPWSQRLMPADAGSTKYVELPWLPYMPRTAVGAELRRSL